jgi:hypothetical protein
MRQRRRSGSGWRDATARAIGELDRPEFDDQPLLLDCAMRGCIE